MKKATLWWSCTFAAVLAACGGGGGGTPSGAGGAVATPLALSGTAAKGAAIAGATVEAKCAPGSATATSDGEGRFQLDLASGSLPCVLKVPAGDGTYLYSAVGGSGTGSFTVNITPLTHLIVAHATGVAPGTLFDEFATRSGAVTAAALTDAVIAVKTTLGDVVDLTGVNPLSDALVVGDANDKKIDALVAALASNGSSLTQLTETVAATAPINTSSTATTISAAGGTASLPAGLLLKPAAANCAALRSGAYRVVLFETAAAGQYATDKVTIDAAALIVTNGDGTTNTMIPVGTCRYTNAKGGEFVVSQAGVIAIRAPNDAGAYRNGIAFPEQAHAVAELAGDWNSLGFERNTTTGSYAADAATVTLGSDGKVSALTYCADVKTCQSSTGAALPAIALSVNATGGFDVTNTTDQYVDRFFTYRAGGGELMAVNISGGGSFSLWTRQRVTTLPTVDAVSRNWNVTVNNLLLSAGTVSESGNTIVSIDTAAGSYVRRSFTGNGSTYDEALQINQPRSGYGFRPAATPTASDGSIVSVREFTVLGLRGMGVSAVSIPFNGSYIVAVGEPGGTWLPAASLSKPFAANCTALRSGPVRVVEALPSAAPGSFSTAAKQFDAPTLQVRNADGSVGLQLAPNGPCRYSSADGSEAVVSQAGVMVVRTPEADGSVRVAMVFPEQTHTVAEFAGSWNKIGYSRTSVGTFVADAASATIDAGGAFGALSYCADVATCVPVIGKTITLAPNAGGGFDRTSSDGWTDRVFAYRAGGGDLMLVNLAGDGSLGLWTQQHINTLPVVGSRGRSWDVSIDKQLHSTGTIPESANTVISVDGTANSYVRSRKTTTGTSFNETVQINKPRDGYAFRPAATPTASDGSTVTVREWTALGMRGMGLSGLSLPSLEWFMVSVGQP